VKTPADISTAFRARGLKLTPQRQAIFAALYANATHPTAEAVYDVVRAQMSSISLRTVYQTLNDLADMGEISQVDLGLGSTRFDPNTEPHHHLVCSQCAAVFDVAVADVPDSLARPVLPDGSGDGFVVEATDVIFRGVCATCARPQPPPPPP
jgi:Fe2+ or Zn2+ uptake regulation protein